MDGEGCMCVGTIMHSAAAGSKPQQQPHEVTASAPQALPPASHFVAFPFHHT